MSTFGEAVNGQIAYEFAASQQYIAIAVYYDSENLPQLAAHFYRQAVEERNHAMIMVQYLLDADRDVTTPGVDAPKTSFSDVVAPVAGKVLEFQTKGQASATTLIPLYRVFDERYVVYWQVSRV